MNALFCVACCDAPLLLSSTFDDDDLRVEEEGHNRYENKEALGWTLDAGARGVAVIGTSVFVSAELLRLAKEAAGCGEDQYDNDGIYDDDASSWMQGNRVCEGRVYGMKPSSILTNILTIVGLISAFFMPLIGSVIDHTIHRKAVGQISAAALSIFIFLQMLLLQRVWLAAAFLQILIAFSYTVHLCVVYAYLPELTTNHERLSHYTAQFVAAQYGSSVVFLIVMVVVFSWINDDDSEETIEAVELSQSFVFGICGIAFGVAWTCLFQQRPALQEVPSGETLISAGFSKMFKTARGILLHHRALFWFLLAITFSEAATYTFSTIAITYMTDQLDFSSRDNGIAILLLLLFGVPGTRLAKWLTNVLNPVRSLQACLLLWIINTSLAAIILKGPGQQETAFVFAMVWGLAIGWINPTAKTLYCTIIPRGQEAELMGTYICAGQLLSWLPSLVFSVMNEAGISMRIGLFSLGTYFAVSFCLLFFIGDYKEAVAHAQQVDEKVAMSKLGILVPGDCDNSCTDFAIFADPLGDMAMTSAP